MYLYLISQFFLLFMFPCNLDNRSDAPQWISHPTYMNIVATKKRLPEKLINSHRWSKWHKHNYLQDTITKLIWILCPQKKVCQLKTNARHAMLFKQWFKHDFLPDSPPKWCWEGPWLLGGNPNILFLIFMIVAIVITIRGNHCHLITITMFYLILMIIFQRGAVRVQWIMAATSFSHYSPTSPWQWVNWFQL